MHEAKKVRFAVLFSLDSSRTRVRLHVYTRTRVRACIYKPREHHGDLRFAPSPLGRGFSPSTFPVFSYAFLFATSLGFPILLFHLSFSLILLPHPFAGSPSPPRADSMRKVNMLQYSNSSRATLY